MQLIIITMRILTKLIGRSFSSAQPVEFLNYYMLRLEYGPDGYYETYELKQTFADQLKKIQDDQQARILGGDNFPKKSTTLIFNCNSIDVPTNFASNCVYKKKNLVTGSKITEMQKISTQKFERVWQFYQPKVK